MSEFLRQKVKERLFELTPRAFEFFAGDLLEYLGLSSVIVTRQSGDGGIDAHCEIVSGGVFRVPAGVQVKRHRQPVPRPEMDRFVGALANRFSCGIFITTGGFTRNALQKAASVPYVSTADGDQIARIMVANEIGISQVSGAIDEEYFGIFENRLRIKEQSAGYDARRAQEVTEADDLVSLRALSYALRVDTTTIRDWVQKGNLRPDAGEKDEVRNGLFFRRSRIEEIRRQFGIRQIPSLAEEWHDSFMQFALHGNLNKSYKPVMLLSMLELVLDDGTIREKKLIERFWSFYQRRHEAGLLAEVESSPLNQPMSLTYTDVRTLLIRHPLDRFIIQGYLEHQPNEGIVRFRPQVWESLRYRDVLELRYSLVEQIERYYSRLYR